MGVPSALPKRMSSPWPLACVKSKLVAVRVTGSGKLATSPITPAARVSVVMGLLYFQPGKLGAPTSPLGGGVVVPPASAPPLPPLAEASGAGAPPLPALPPLPDAPLAPPLAVLPPV